MEHETERAEKILDYYFWNGDGCRLDHRIQQWLCMDAVAEEKDAALRKMWDLHVRCAEPDDHARRSLEAIRKRIGFAAQPPTGELSQQCLRPTVAASQIPALTEL